MDNYIIKIDKIIMSVEVEKYVTSVEVIFV
jgi:hypothetical protein